MEGRLPRTTFVNGNTDRVSGVLNPETGEEEADICGIWMDLQKDAERN